MIQFPAEASATGRENAKMRFSLIRPGIQALACILTSAFLADFNLYADEPMMAPSGQSVLAHTDSGEIENTTELTRSVYMDVIHEPTAHWIRLSLAGTELEGNSVLKIQSLLDGEIQYLGTRELQLWKRTSAYFNGSSLLVEIIASPGTTNRLVINEIQWDDARVGDDPYCGYCGDDDRSLVIDNSVCRILGGTYSCTGVIIDSESNMITAGHCMIDGTALVCEFDVPNSNLDCSMNHPPVADQFPVTGWICSAIGPGEDWAAVKLGTNSNGERPYDRYGVSQPLAANMAQAGASIDATGYGTDFEQCLISNTLQQGEGTIIEVNDRSFTFNADVTYGSSGSPIKQNGGNRVLGIATHCPCPNVATRIDHPDFVAARDMLFNGVLGDNCETAMFAVAGANPFTTVGAVESEFGAPDDTMCPDSYLDWETSADIWFSWQPPSSGTLSINTCDVDSYDTSIVAYEGDDCGSLIQIACNGDADPEDESDCQNYSSAINDIQVSALSTYFFRIGGWQGATGPGTLWIEHSPTPATGACCIGESCLELYDSECDDAQGTYQGSGTSCGDIACDLPLPTGACCAEDTCQEVLESACIGEYLGDWIECVDVTCTVPCPGDFDLDGAVDVDDLLTIIANYSQTDTPYDLDGDGAVDVDDLLELISAFGPCD